MIRFDYSAKRGNQLPDGLGVQNVQCTHNVTNCTLYNENTVHYTLYTVHTEYIVPREEINSQLDWLYTNEVCSYPVLQNGTTAKVDMIY